MTPLAGAVLSLLEAEASFPPLKAASISRVLWVCGHSPEARPATAAEIEAALAELMQAGLVERVHSARMGVRWRATRHPAAVVAEAEDGT